MRKELIHCNKPRLDQCLYSENTENLIHYYYSSIQNKMQTHPKPSARAPEKPLVFHPNLRKPKPESITLPLKNLKPSPSKDLSPRSLEKCLEFEDDLESSSHESFVTQPKVPEDRAKEVFTQVTALRGAIEDYDGYLRGVQKTSAKGRDTLRSCFEDEYQKLEQAVDNFKDLVKEHAESLTKQLLHKTLNQQRTLTVENKEIQSKFDEIKRIKGEIFKTAKIASKYAGEEEQKYTSEDQAEFKAAKGHFFELSAEFEKTMKFKPRGLIHRCVATVLPCDTTKTCRLESQPLDLGNKNFPAEIALMVSKLRDVRRPILACFEPGTVSKYTIGVQKIEQQKVSVPLGTSLDGAVVLTHPNGGSIYFVTGGSIIQYDLNNGVLLKKPVNFQSLETVGSAVTLLEHYIYILGGYKDHSNKATSTAYRFNIITEKWYPLAPMHIERCHAFATAVGDSKILVAGGENESSPALSSVEIFSVRENAWEICQFSLKIPRKLGAAASVAKDKALVFGGIGIDKELVKEVEEIDLSGAISKKIAEQPNPRRGNTVSVIGEEILILGGYSKIIDGSMGEKYLRRENTWTTLASKTETMPEKGIIGLLFE